MTMEIVYYLQCLVWVKTVVGCILDIEGSVNIQMGGCGKPLILWIEHSVGTNGMMVC
jgi:hypothetical protein